MDYHLEMYPKYIVMWKNVDDEECALWCHIDQIQIYIYQNTYDI